MLGLAADWIVKDRFPTRPGPVWREEPGDWPRSLLDWFHCTRRVKGFFGFSANGASYVGPA